MSAPARIGAALVAGALLWGAWTWWNSPERRIRRALDALAEGLSHDAPASPLAAASAAAELQEYLAEDVVVAAGGRVQEIRGRPAVLAAVVRIRSAVPAMRVSLVDLRVTPDPQNASAAVEGTVSVVMTDRAGQERSDAREVVVLMRPIEGRWVVTQVRTVEVLEPVS